MSKRLSTKQFRFLQSCNLTIEDRFNRDPLKWGERRPMPYYWGPQQMEEWGFWTESEAERFADRLVSRGLLRRENHHFLWLTDAGRAAIGVEIPTPSQGVQP